MARFSSLLVFTSCLLACGLLAPASNPSQSGQSQSAHSELPTRPPIINPKAKELLDKCIQALGGDAFLRFKSLTTRGRTFAIEDEQTAGLAPFESFVLYPDKRRFSYGKKKPVILINDGDKQWELD